MDWYLMAWRKYAEFDGRSRRTEYWMFVLFHFLAILALAAVGGVGLAMSRDYGAFLFIPVGLYSLAGIIPTLAVATRRFHDSGKSGWMLLLLIVLGIIPVAGFIAAVIQIVLLCQDSEPGVNRYGPNPKFPEQAPGMFAGNAAFAPAGYPAQPQPLVGQYGVGLCNRCRATINPGSSFCGSCGAHV
jgi:uncharacterized membrane protein YhaH (DUF805 family)